MPTRLQGFLKKLAWRILKLDYSTGILSLILLPAVMLEARRADNIDAMVDLLFSRRPAGLLLAPMQVREEVEQLAKLVASRRPRTVLEIGTARGGTLALWTRAASRDATIITIDLPGGLFGGGYGVGRVALYKSLRLGRQEIVLLRRDSHDPQTLAIVKKVLRGRRVEFMFIDGDHSYEGVRMDYRMYSGLLAQGALLAFHDIVPGPSHLVGGVPRFWKELKAALEPPCRVYEFVRDWGQGGFGIGVVEVGEGCRLPRI